jgi:UDP-N-acetylmuramoyl-L-alanyl-D-glutamate--2,6-diaminopimelate ligase
VKLGDLAANVRDARVIAGADFEVRRIVADSRDAQPGDLFVAVRGFTVDSHRFVPELAARGVAVAVEDPATAPPGAPTMLLVDSRYGLAETAAAFFGNPSRQLAVVGITGTDGKTTVAHMLAHVLESAGVRTGLLTTVAVRTGPEDTPNPTGLTTMEALDVQESLSRMVAAGLKAAVIEASSHALVQHRVAACDFDVAAITNVGRDHLEFHQTWDAYVEAKARLIDLCRRGFPKGITKAAVLNRDDASFAPLSEHPIDRRFTYSFREQADVRADAVRLHERGANFVLHTEEAKAAVELHVPARFNVSNALCAAAAATALGLELDLIADGLSSFAGAAGRLEPVDLGQPFRVFIDYAHSASSLNSVLTELRESTPGRLIAVFGSTARSDHDRAGMGRAAAEHADYFVITTDDPIDESPSDIARDVALGAKDADAASFEIVLDRTEAIARAINIAGPGDTVLLAGKGHEKFMLFQGRRREPWDERAAAEAALREAGYGVAAATPPPD